MLTPGGRGAIATIRVLGDATTVGRSLDVHFRAVNARPWSEQPADRPIFGYWGSQTAEEVVLCRCVAQRQDPEERSKAGREAEDVVAGKSGGQTASATDGNEANNRRAANGHRPPVAESVEIHCHGGRAAVERILADLRSTGVTVRPWKELIRRSEGLFHAEWTEALSQATTLRTAAILQGQLEAWSAFVAQLEGVFGLRRASPESVADKLRAELIGRIDALLSWSAFARHLTTPWDVVLCGRPNVGKSSLLNALLGYNRAIVFDAPGTTRDLVSGETAFEGWPVRLTDTAGLRETTATIESEGIARARQRLEQADLCLLLVDLAQPPQQEDRRLLADRPEAIVVAHKCDLPDAWGAELPESALRVSSLTKEGLEALIDAIVARLVPDVPQPGTPLPFTDRLVEWLWAVREALRTARSPEMARLASELGLSEAGAQPVE